MFFGSEFYQKPSGWLFRRMKQLRKTATPPYQLMRALNECDKSEQNPTEMNKIQQFEPKTINCCWYPLDCCPGELEMILIVPKYLSAPQNKFRTMSEQNLVDLSWIWLLSIRKFGIFYWYFGLGFGTWIGIPSCPESPCPVSGAIDALCVTWAMPETQKECPNTTGKSAGELEKLIWQNSSFLVRQPSIWCRSSDEKSCFFKIVRFWLNSIIYEGALQFIACYDQNLTVATTFTETRDKDHFFLGRSSYGTLEKALSVSHSGFSSLLISRSVSACATLLPSTNLGEITSLQLPRVSLLKSLWSTRNTSKWITKFPFFVFC